MICDHLKNTGNMIGVGSPIQTNPREHSILRDCSKHMGINGEHHTIIINHILKGGYNCRHITKIIIR